MYNKHQDMYTYIIKDVHGQWFKSKFGFFTKQEAEEDAAGVAEYAFVDTVKVVDEDDYDYIHLDEKTKLN